MRTRFSAVFLESDDIAALCIRAGVPICVPAVGASDSIAGSQGDAESQTQVLAGATRIRAHLAVFVRYV